MKYKITFFRTLTGESGNMSDTAYSNFFLTNGLTLEEAVEAKASLEKTHGTFATFSIVEDK